MQLTPPDAGCHIEVEELHQQAADERGAIMTPNSKHACAQYQASGCIRARDIIINDVRSAQPHAPSLSQCEAVDPTLMVPALTGLTHCRVPHARPRKWHTPLRSPSLTYMSSWHAGEWRRWNRVAAAASAADACSRTCRTSSTNNELPLACGMDVKLRRRPYSQHTMRTKHWQL